MRLYAFRNTLLALVLAIPLAGCPLFEADDPTKADDAVREKVFTLKSVDYRGADAHAILIFEDGSVVATLGAMRLYKPKTKYRLKYNAKTGLVMDIAPANSTAPPS